MDNQASGVMRWVNIVNGPDDQHACPLVLEQPMDFFVGKSAP